MQGWERWDTYFLPPSTWANIKASIVYLLILRIVDHRNAILTHRKARICTVIEDPPKLTTACINWTGRTNTALLHCIFLFGLVCMTTRVMPKLTPITTIVQLSSFQSWSYIADLCMY